MANDRLRQDMADAKMTARDLATACDVDEKTVARWLADAGRTPHPRHRWAASDALGVDESVIWPDVVRSAVKTGPDREVVAVYLHLRRRQDDGLFDRFAHHVAQLWDSGREITAVSKQ